MQLAVRSKQQRLPQAGLWRLSGFSPYYETRLGAAYLGDAIRLIENLPDSSVNLIVTSPPFALKRKKEYGNVEPKQYVSWFSPFANQFRRVLKDDGSLVIHIGDSWNEGEPTKSLYAYKLLLNLCEEKQFRLAQDFYWHNPAKLPAPAEWVNVRRVRVKDTVEFVWWLSKNEFPKADNRKILKPYSDSMIGLLKNGYKAKLRPSGHNISTKFSKDRGGAIPPNIFSILQSHGDEPTNLFTISNTDSNSRYLKLCRDNGAKVHPARYPDAIPEFFIRFLTNAGDRVLDPFGGSNVTGAVAERLMREWMCFEIREEYLRGSMFRFDNEQLMSKPKIVLAR
jgi:site-specific DNA-methyltransferase (cytosine-N4-specific)